MSVGIIKLLDARGGSITVAIDRKLADLAVMPEDFILREIAVAIRCAKVTHDWKDKTITLGELSRLIREERVIDDTIRAEWMGEGMTAIAHKAGMVAGLSDEEQLEFVSEAKGERG